MTEAGTLLFCSVYQNNMELVTMQYSLVIAGVILMLGACGLITLKTASFRLLEILPR